MDNNINVNSNLGTLNETINKQMQKSLISFITPLIPIMIKLFFSNNLGSKIACLLELGNSLNLSNVIKQTLDDQNIFDNETQQ